MKIGEVEGEKWLAEKLIGLRFSMEDRNIIATEAQTSIATIEQELKVIMQQKCIFEKKVCYIFILIWCFVL